MRPLIVWDARSVRTRSCSISWRYSLQEQPARYAGPLAACVQQSKRHLLQREKGGREGGGERSEGCARAGCWYMRKKGGEEGENCQARKNTQKQKKTMIHSISFIHHSLLSSWKKEEGIKPAGRFTGAWKHASRRT